jgi:hypothetical protein
MRRLPARLIAWPLPWVVSATIQEVDMLATASKVMAANMPPSRSSREFCSLLPTKRITCLLPAIGFHCHAPSVNHPLFALANKRGYLFCAAGFPPHTRAKKT